MNEKARNFEEHRDHWHPWFKAASQIGFGSWCEIKHGSAEHDDWVRYFRGIGWMPMVVRELQRGRSFTMPKQWPSLLPPNFYSGETEPKGAA